VRACRPPGGRKQEGDLDHVAESELSDAIRRGWRQRRAECDLAARVGALEQIIINCQNLEIFVIAKCLANWLSSSFLTILLASLILKKSLITLIIIQQIYLSLIYICLKLVDKK
jgi:hypothetical protein